MRPWYIDHRSTRRMSKGTVTRGKSPSGTLGLFDLGNATAPAASRSPSPAVRQPTGGLFNLKKADDRILTTTSQPKSGYIPGARSTNPGLADNVRLRPASATTHDANPREDVDVNLDDAIGGTIEAHNPRMTDVEIKNLLVGYVSLPKKYWKTGLVYRQHIRYIRLKDNIFVRGGFIAGIGKQRNKDTLSMVNCFNSRKPGYYAWVVNIDALKAIFIRRQDWDAIRESLGMIAPCKK